MGQWRQLFPFQQCKFRVLSRGEIGGDQFDFELLDLHKGSNSKMVYLRTAEGWEKRSDLQDLQQHYSLTDDQAKVFEMHFRELIDANMHIWNPSIADFGELRVQYTDYPGHGYYFTYPDRSENFEVSNQELRNLGEKSDRVSTARELAMLEFYTWATEHLPAHLTWTRR